jgi:hypothetical protein
MAFEQAADTARARCEALAGAAAEAGAALKKLRIVILGFGETENGP